MSRKRPGSLSTQSGPQPAKILKYRRSNSGSIPDKIYDEVAHTTEELVQLCTKLENLLLGSHDTYPEAKFRQSDSSKKAYAFPTAFGKEIIDAENDGVPVEKWLSKDSVRSSRKWLPEVPVGVLESIAEEGEKSGEESKESGEESKDSSEEEDVGEADQSLSFSHLKHLAQGLDNNVKRLKILRVESRNFDVEIIPFSSVVADDYNRLAITDCDFNVDVDDIWEILNEQQHATFGEVTYEALTYFATELDSIQRAYLNPWSETVARKVIEGYFDSIRNPKIFPDTSYTIITSPEFGILERSKKKEPNGFPIINDDKGLKTYLNGSTDYLTILTAGTKLQSQFSSGSKQRRSKSGQKKWLEGIMLTARTDDTVRLSICEAKWPGAKLENHVPQVLAEAIGLQLKTRRHYVPFCLSNGTEWVFGVLQSRGNQITASYRFWVTKIYRVNGAREAFRVLWLLRFWTVAKEADVWRLGCPNDWLDAPGSPQEQEPEIGLASDLEIETRGRTKRRARGNEGDKENKE